MTISGTYANLITHALNGNYITSSDIASLADQTHQLEATVIFKWIFDFDELSQAFPGGDVKSERVHCGTDQGKYINEISRLKSLAVDRQIQHSYLKNITVGADGGLALCSTDSKEYYLGSASFSYTCDSGCSGRGRVRCGQCGGSGNQSCNYCGGGGYVHNGSSKQKCGLCHGSGRSSCSTCMGSGQVSHQACNGTGYKTRVTKINLLAKCETPRAKVTPPILNDAFIDYALTHDWVGVARVVEVKQAQIIQSNGKFAVQYSMSASVAECCLSIKGQKAIFRAFYRERTYYGFKNPQIFDDLFSGITKKVNQQIETDRSKTDYQRAAPIFAEVIGAAALEAVVADIRTNKLDNEDQIVSALKSKCMYLISDKTAKNIADGITYLMDTVAPEYYGRALIPIHILSAITIPALTLGVFEYVKNQTIPWQIVLYILYCLVPLIVLNALVTHEAAAKSAAYCRKVQSLLPEHYRRDHNNKKLMDRAMSIWSTWILLSLAVAIVCRLMNWRPVAEFVKTVNIFV